MRKIIVLSLASVVAFSFGNFRAIGTKMPQMLADEETHSNGGRVPISEEQRFPKGLLAKSHGPVSASQGWVLLRNGRYYQKNMGAHLNLPYSEFSPTPGS